MFNSNIEKGFTLLELLVVIAIIGILASVIMTSVSSAKSKAQISSYKAETSHSIPGLISQCSTGAISLPAATLAIKDAAWVVNGADATNVCGASGNGLWKYTVNSNYSIAQTNCGAATVSQTGVTFASAC